MIWYWQLLILVGLLLLVWKGDAIWNWFKSVRCSGHDYELHYRGMNVYGFTCLKCGHVKYEKKKRYN